MEPYNKTKKPKVRKISPYLQHMAFAQICEVIGLSSQKTI
jgi:hypothetical protein